MDPEILQRFVESVGQKADVDLYLKLFRSQRKESFAIIVADAQIVRAALDPFHFDLRILAGLGLYPVVLVGLLDARDADKQSQRILEWLLEDEVSAKVIGSGTDLPQEIQTSVRQTLEENTIPIVSLDAAKELAIDDRFRLLRTLAASLESRKVIFLSTSSGIEREGAPRISLVNLSTDYEHLLTTNRVGEGGLCPPQPERGKAWKPSQGFHSSALPRRHASLLRHVKILLDQLPQRMNVAVVNPLHLLRELFTVSGAGTLIRKGSRIERHDGLAAIDRGRLTQLLESAFGRALVPGAMEDGGLVVTQSEHLYLEENYLGAAILGNTPIAPYLSKFAVNRQAQGEGIGGEIWSMLIRDFPVFFWRAHPSNPIVPFYAKQCDGLVRFPEWHIFWRGLPPDKIQPAIEHALSLPRAFVT
jgi:bifunctional N-acetylglutamate synthase/kinase